MEVSIEVFDKSIIIIEDGKHYLYNWENSKFCLENLIDKFEKILSYDKTIIIISDGVFYLLEYENNQNTLKFISRLDEYYYITFGYFCYKLDGKIMFYYFYLNIEEISENVEFYRSDANYYSTCIFEQPLNTGLRLNNIIVSLKDYKVEFIYNKHHYKLNNFINLNIQKIFIYFNLIILQSIDNDYYMIYDNYFEIKLGIFITYKKNICRIENLSLSRIKIKSCFVDFYSNKYHFYGISNNENIYFLKNVKNNFEMLDYNFKKIYLGERFVIAIDYQNNIWNIGYNYFTRVNNGNTPTIIPEYKYREFIHVKSARF